MRSDEVHKVRDIERHASRPVRGLAFLESSACSSLALSFCLSSSCTKSCFSASFCSRSLTSSCGRVPQQRSTCARVAERMHARDARGAGTHARGREHRRTRAREAYVRMDARVRGQTKAPQQAWKSVQVSVEKQAARKGERGGRECAF
eukprot:6177918-Pleurochrysis_carterae.AAC.3